MNLPKLFGTSGIRGHAQKLFTNQFSYDLGRAFARFLDKYSQDGPIAIGMDPRGSSPRILKAVKQGLVQEGREILDQGACPIPAINYALIVTPAVGGIEITGSHVAPHLNGIKFFAFKEEILKKHESEITSIYTKLQKKILFKKRKTNFKKDQSAKIEYEEMLVNLGKKFPSWPVVVDPGNGAQSELMTRVLNRLGLKVFAINDHLQGKFLSRDTEVEDSFLKLQKEVLKKKALLGIGYDADGDRAAFVNEKGQFIPGDYSGALIAREISSPVIVTPINTSAVVNFIGKKIKRTKVGSPYVVASMKKTGALFGFEGNGGGIFAEIMKSRDGGSTTVNFLKILRETGLKPSQLVSQLPKFFITKLKTDCPRSLNKAIFAQIRKKYSKEKIEDLDGLKIWLNQNTWLLFRPSQNAPEFRVFAEAKTLKKADQLAQEGLLLVKKIINEKTG